MKPTRRQLLPLPLLGLGLPLPLLAASAPKRRFLFVVCGGGWDATRTLQPVFELDGVDMEGDAELATAGDLRWVSSPERPSVDAFFASHGQRSVIVNGLEVPSIAHDICTQRLMTGGLAADAADWGAVLAAAGGASFSLPQLVIAGPSFAGAFGAEVVPMGSAGQLGQLISGEIKDRETGLHSIRLPSDASQELIEAHVRARVQARHALAASSREQDMLAAMDQSLDRAASLVTSADAGVFTSGSQFADHADTAVQVLSAGLSRCVSLAWPPSDALGWDTHIDNDSSQSTSFEELFADLDALVSQLASTSSPDGGTLADDTVVVVWSEMGRTPALNSDQGKDHWPYTSCLLVGAGLVGGLSVGGFEEDYTGATIDPDDLGVGGGVVISPAVLGATLLELGGVSAGAWIDDATPLTGVLA